MGRLNPAILAFALALPGAAAWAQAPKLNIDQQNKLRVGKLDRNSKDRTAKDLLKTYEAFAGKPDMLIPAALLKKGLADIDTVMGACATILKGFDEVQMPADHPEAKDVRAWAETTSAALEPMKKDYEARLPEAEKLGNPANYPDLDKDGEAVDAVREEFAKGLRGEPEEVAARAAKFAPTVEWQQAAFKKYRSFMVLNGGAKNPLYVKFQRSAEALKKMREDATAFVEASQKEVPGLLKEAEEMAAKAAAEKRPMFFSGGVKQKVDQALRKIAVCEALVGKDSDQAAPLRKQCDEAQARIDVQAASLKDQILVDARAPKDEYSGPDKEELREKLRAEWKKAYPQDELLEIRFPKPWERKTEWSLVGDSLQKSDMSYLYARAIVKTAPTVATVYVAVVNKNHMQSDSITLGVHTKKGIWVSAEVLISNLDK